MNEVIDRNDPNYGKPNHHGEACPDDCDAPTEPTLLAVELTEGDLALLGDALAVLHGHVARRSEVEWFCERHPGIPMTSD